MKKIYLYLFEPFNNLSKRLYITIITILFLAAFIIFLSVFSNVFSTENMTLSLRNNETYLTDHQMYIYQPIPSIMHGDPDMHEELNYLIINDKEKYRDIEKQTDEFICSLYSMQNEDFIMEKYMYRTFPIAGLPKLFDQYLIQVDESFFEHEYLPICKGLC